MKDTLRTRLDTGRTSAVAFWARLRMHRYWVQLIAITVLAIFTLLIVGRSAYARADAYAQEAARLELTQIALDRWAGTVEWPTPEETESWSESESFLNRFGSTSTAPLSLANELARRGEEMSRGNVRIRMANPDTAYFPPEVAVGPWRMTSGTSAIVVEMSGDWASAISFLGALPPHVEVAGLELASTDAGADISVLLLSRAISREAQ